MFRSLFWSGWLVMAKSLGCGYRAFFERVLEKGMSPAAYGDLAFQSVKALEEAFEDQGADMDRLFAPEFEADDLGAFEVVHVAEPADGAADFFKVKGLGVDDFWLPDGHFLADGDEVGAGRAEDDDASALAGEVLHAEEGVDLVDGDEALGKGRSGAGHGGFSKAKGPY